MSEQVLSISGLQKYYGAKLILDDVNLQLNRGERAILVGENGVGKSTLARLILGIEASEGGAIRIASGNIVTYLAQEIQVNATLTVGEFIRESLGELSSLQRRLHELEGQMSESTDLADVLEEYGQLQTLFDLRGGYTIEARRNRFSQAWTWAISTRRG